MSSPFKSVSGRDPSGRARVSACCWGGEPTVDVGDQQRNQTANAIDIRTAAALPLTVLLAIPLTVCEALVVATAASVATTTKARANSRQIMSTMTIP